MGPAIVHITTCTCYRTGQTNYFIIRVPRRHHYVVVRTNLYEPTSSSYFEVRTNIFTRHKIHAAMDKGITIPYQKMDAAMDKGITITFFFFQRAGITITYQRMGAKGLAELCIFMIYHFLAMHLSPSYRRM